MVFVFLSSMNQPCKCYQIVNYIIWWAKFHRVVIYTENVKKDGAIFCKINVVSVNVSVNNQVLTLLLTQIDFNPNMYRPLHSW